MAHDEIAFIKLLQSKGLRVTEQRLLILDAVCQGSTDKGHIAVGDILLRVKETAPEIDPSTVYRTLDLLCELGVVAANTIHDGSTVYELVGQTPHHHLICTVCGREYEISHAAFAPLFAQIERDYDFSVNARHLMIEGVCENCKKPESFQKPKVFKKTTGFQNL